jgi:hypothetical protein
MEKYRVRYMQKLSKKDRKMLIALAVFLIGIVYYEFLLTPLYNMKNSVQKSLVNKRKELLVVKTKLSGLTHYKKKINDLKKIICITKNNNMPSINEMLNAKIKAVMSAAEKASVKILSLKPINAISENEDGTVKTIKDKYILIDGNSDINSFLNFLMNLWGVELEEIELSSVSKDGSKLRFYIKVSFLPKTNIDIASDKNVSPVDLQFGVKHNVFAKIIPPPPPPPPKPPGWKPSMAKPVHHLNDAKLLGVAEFGNEKMAIIEDGKKKETDFFFIGSKFRDAKLWKVNDKSAVFLFSDEGTVTLKLPDEKKYHTTDDSNDKTRKKGHLGILAETFTEQLARQHGLTFEPGLLVISSGTHGDVLQKGDIVTSINGQQTPNFEAALGVMKAIYVGEELKISLLRHGVFKNISYKAD